MLCYTSQSVIVEEEVVQLLLEARVNHRNALKRSHGAPLLMAAGADRLANIKMLMRKGAEIDSADFNKVLVL